MKIILLSVCLLFVWLGNVQAEGLFRWKDKDGKVHYGDRPAEDAVEAEAKKFSAPTLSDDDTLSYTSRMAKQNFPVTLYVTPNCGEYCTQSRNFLNKRGIPFVEKMLNSKESTEEFQKKTGGNSIPSLTVGKNLLSGFEAGQWNSELDIAGYPKIAPYGVKPVQPATTPNAEVKTEEPAKTEQ